MMRLRQTTWLLAFILFFPFLGAAKPDPYSQVPPTDAAKLRTGIERYAHDEISGNWSDLYEIAIPGFALESDYDDISGKVRWVTKDRFADLLDLEVSGGSRPRLRSFELVSVSSSKNGYLIQACAKAQRETFHFKGVIEFSAYRSSDGTFRFGGWTYIHHMPHSCSQKDDRNQ